MSERLETLKYTFTVEGDTENWYLEWLKRQINQFEGRKYNVSFDINVQPSPRKFYKTVNSQTTPKIIHICDIESPEPDFIEKFQSILTEMREAKRQKKITYTLGYSNFTFELWMILHKKDCNGCLSNRKQYLKPINQAYNKHFKKLDDYKKEDNFKKCLEQLSLDFVREAIKRADAIMDNCIRQNKKITKHCGYPYYKDNPALSIHDAIRNILNECGIE